MTCWRPATTCCRPGTEDAGQVTEMAGSQLHTWGAWDQEASLIHDTCRLPADSPRQPPGSTSSACSPSDRGDYDEAERQYQQALDINEQLGDQAGMATATTSSASSPRTAGTTPRPTASTSRPSTSSSRSATRPA